MSDLPLYVRDFSKPKLWHHWVDGSAEDSLLTTFEPSALPTSRLIPTAETSAIVARAFGGDAENETATLQITGWNDTGPGMLLWNGQIICGAHTFTDYLLPDIASAAWFEIDTWTATYNSCSATVYGANGQSIIIVPTLSFAHLYIEATNKDGVTGGPPTQMLKLAIMWKPYTAAITI